jgi:azurin
MRICSVHRAFAILSFSVPLGVTILQPTAAFADVEAAESCAATLSANQRLIYDTIKPDFRPDADLVKQVRPKVIALVKTGKLPRASAPDDAQTAAKCLKMLQS